MSAQLAELGASVVKVEPANEVGDSYRGSGTYIVARNGEKIGTSFGVVNRGEPASLLF